MHSGAALYPDTTHFQSYSVAKSMDKSVLPGYFTPFLDYGVISTAPATLWISCSFLRVRMLKNYSYARHRWITGCPSVATQIIAATQLSLNTGMMSNNDSSSSASSRHLVIIAQITVVQRGGSTIFSIFIPGQILGLVTLSYVKTSVLIGLGEIKNVESAPVTKKTLNCHQTLSPCRGWDLGTILP